MKTSLVIQEAKEVKQFIEKNKTLPKFCTINNNQYSIYTASLLFGKFLQNRKSTNIDAKNIQNYNTKNNYKINEKILPNDYLDMNNRFVKYCNTYQRVPSFITTKKSKEKVSYELFVYCLCKIITFYSNNSKTLPAYCIFNSSDIQNKATSKTTNVKKTTSSTSNASKKTVSSKTKNTKTTKTAHPNCKNPYTSKPQLLTTQNGLGQDYPWDCSCAALQQCFFKLSRKKIPESTLIKVMGVTTSGVGHDGIATGIAWFNKKYGTKYKLQWKNFSDLGSTRDKRFTALAKLLCRDDTAILTHIGYGNSGKSPITKNTTIFGHYECLRAIDVKNQTVTALNSLGDKRNLNAYYGHIQTRSFATQASFFANTPGGQSAIAIITKK